MIGKGQWIDGHIAFGANPNGAVEIDVAILVKDRPAKQMRKM